MGKGHGFLVAKFLESKFSQVTHLHAEAYPSAEFRHGPLSMVDDEVQTPVAFLLLDDFHFKQVCSNISEVKGRGAKTLVVTNCKQKMEAHIDAGLMDFVIDVP